MLRKIIRLLGMLLDARKLPMAACRPMRTLRPLYAAEINPDKQQR